MTAVEQRLYTLEELHEIEDLPENRDKRLELIDGVIVEKDLDMETGEVSASFLPSMIAGQIVTAINNYLKDNPIGYATSSDDAYKMRDSTRLIPDVGYISRERLPAMPQREVPIPPDLAIEVKSPSDNPRDLHKKALKYLALGTRVVWVVYPDEQNVDIYRPPQTEGDDARIQSLYYEDILDGGEVLPNFKLPLKEIFPA